jgi:predicted AlkP superfamily pyrophosphatase or phosphodiesterase
MSAMKTFRLLISSLLLVLVAFVEPGDSAPRTRTRAAAPAPVPPHKVVLLSLDGAAADVLHELHKEGALTGGFDRFFREGQVADRLVPVNPTLTAVNHISLATGYPAARTGIVSNRFHAAGTAFLDSVSGFEASIETETLWEAAQRQGKKVGVLTWPGVDATLSRRTADWGMVWVEKPDREPVVVSLGRTAWSRMPDGPMTARVESHSPIQRSLAIVGPEGQPGREFELMAVDRTDDGKVNYDAIVPATRGDRVVLRPGEWGRVPCQDPRPERSIRGTFCWIKLLSLDPSLESARVYFNGLYSNQAYPPMTYAVNLAQTGLLWPGPPDDRSLADSWQGRPGIDLDTWLEQADRSAAFFGGALRNASGLAWNLLMGYIPVIDEAGHQLLLTDPGQPGYSAERRDALAGARRKVWQMVDRELDRFLKTLDLKTTTVVVVSDHGMAPVCAELEPNVILRDKGVLMAGPDGKILAEGTRAWAASSGGIAHVYVDPAAPDRDKLIADLKSTFAGWSAGGQKPIARVLTRKESAALELNHPNSGDLILFAADGYTFGGGLKRENALGTTTAYGMHGYPNTDRRMAGIYMALGAGIKPGKAGTVRNVDVAGRVAQWLGIEKPRPTAP